jgi:hypothetical protein
VERAKQIFRTIMWIKADIRMSTILSRDFVKWKRTFELIFSDIIYKFGLIKFHQTSTGPFGTGICAR